MKKVKLYIGVMTGNSLDAADAVLASFDDGVQIHRHASVVINEKLAENCRRLIGGAGDLDLLMNAQNDITRVCATAVCEVCSGCDLADIVAVGCHGQTLRHAPKKGWTLQILNGALLAELTGLDVVCDFRSRDIAGGGCGAPLAPLFHAFVFANEAPCAIVNIGGIANITLLSDKNSADNIRAHDTGPGNILLDAWFRKNHAETIGQPVGGKKFNPQDKYESDERFDKDGNWAAGGTVIPALLDALLAHPFFSQPPPKSCGYEEFSLNHFESMLSAANPQDAQATLLQLTATTIANAVNNHADTAPKKIYLCGGGGKNKALVKRLKKLNPRANIRPADDKGIPAQQMEAAAFAYLAKMHQEKTKANTKKITGAKTPRILGARYPW